MSEQTNDVYEVITTTMQNMVKCIIVRAKDKSIAAQLWGGATHGMSIEQAIEQANKMCEDLNKGKEQS